MTVKLNKRVSWLMETVQQSLFPQLAECLHVSLTKQEQHLVKILELVQIEKYVPARTNRQWLGRPINERETLARAFITKAILRYQHTSFLHNALQSSPNLRASVALPGVRMFLLNRHFPEPLPSVPRQGREVWCTRP
jgi:hypothetical protein